MSKLFSHELLKTATEQTGLAEFGGGDVFQHDFNLFVSALDMNNVPEDRHQRCIEYILHLLKTRLWFEKDLKDHPEILEEELLPPVAIVSMPKTGTSKLQRIMGTTNHFQNLLYWHTYTFARIPGENDGGNAIRLRLATEFLDWMVRTVPIVMQSHPMAPEEVEEEFLMNEASFRTRMIASLFPVPAYSAWLDEADMSPTYDYLLKQFKYMQWQFRLNGSTPRPWLLKSPGMLGNEDQLMRIFPQGMKVISPHRSPVDIIPTNCRTADAIMQIFGKKVPGELIGPAILDHWFGPGIHRYMEWRKNNSSIEILDLGFDEISNDSIGTARKVSDFLGIPLTGEAVRNIQQWDIENPRNKFGKSKLTYEEYGIDAAQVEKIFASYINQYSDYF